jgi:hypothetical protein
LKFVLSALASDRSSSEEFENCLWAHLPDGAVTRTLVCDRTYGNSTALRLVLSDIRLKPLSAVELASGRSIRRNASQVRGQFHVRVTAANSGCTQRGTRHRGLLRLPPKLFVDLHKGRLFGQQRSVADDEKKRRLCPYRIE